MSRWTRILCAVDTSEQSRRALAQALELARSRGAELTLAHVVPEPQHAADVIAFSPQEVALQLAREFGPWLERERAEAERQLGAPVKAQMLAGRPGAELVRLAHELGAELVVLGTHGRTGLERALLGSVAEWVVRHAPCSVLVVRETPEQD